VLFVVHQHQYFYRQLHAVGKDWNLLANATCCRVVPTLLTSIRVRLDFVFQRLGGHLFEQFHPAEALHNQLIPERPKVREPLDLALPLSIVDTLDLALPLSIVDTLDLALPLSIVDTLDLALPLSIVDTGRTIVGPGAGRTLARRDDGLNDIIGVRLESIPSRGTYV
jgi:hypothetical protein